MHKGSQLYVEGKLQTRKWTDNEGKERWTTEIIAEDFRLMGGNPNNQQQGAQQRPQAPTHSGGGQQQQQRPQNNQPPADFDDDIPF